MRAWKTTEATMDKIDFTKLFTQRKIHFEAFRDEDNRLWRAMELKTTMPLVRMADQPIFKTFVPLRKFKHRPLYTADHYIRMDAQPISIWRSLLGTELTGRWSLRKESDTITIWVENDDDFILLKAAGLFVNAQTERVERDRDREKLKTYRNLTFSISERRRLLQLLNRAVKDGEKLRAYSNRKTDKSLLDKIL